jgi:hypothetical protein
MNHKGEGENVPQIESEVKSMVALGDLEKIKIALRETKNLDLVKAIIDRAELLKIYRKQIGDTLEMQNEAGEIRIRAQRKAGELLIEEPEKRGGGRKSEAYKNQKRLDVEFDFQTAGRTSFKEQKECERYKSIASIPEEVFEQHIQETKEKQEILISNYRIMR